MKIKTWLPVFPGFYNTIFEPNNEDVEIDEINRLRLDQGLPKITYDECEWNYKEYFEEVSTQCVCIIENELRQMGMVISIKFEELRSPQFYNYSNDAINIEVELSDKNIDVIKTYIYANINPFSVYIKDEYTSRSGFYSRYSNDVRDWVGKENLEHEHKLGSILQFILFNEEFDDMSLFDLITDTYICASNYSELTGE